MTQVTGVVCFQMCTCATCTPQMCAHRDSVIQDDGMMIQGNAIQDAFEDSFSHAQQSDELMKMTDCKQTPVSLALD